MVIDADFKLEEDGSYLDTNQENFSKPVSYMMNPILNNLDYSITIKQDLRIRI